MRVTGMGFSLIAGYSAAMTALANAGFGCAPEVR
jgi:hypothetical protein